MPGTVEQREQAVRELRTKNLKDIFELPPELKLLGHPVKIFNVSPLPYLRSMGSYGQWLIPACPEGAEVSPAKEVPFITNDPVHVDMEQMAHRHDSGRKVAADILGFGQFHTPGEDLRKWGCFIADGEEPTAKEIAKAKAMWHKTCDVLINEADNFYNQGPQHYDNVTDLHRLCSRIRGVDKIWSRGLEELVLCPACATRISPAAAICSSCKTVIDEKRVILLKVPGYEHLWNKKREKEQ